MTALLADLHAKTRLSYRAVAKVIGIDHGYWRRLTVGERCPSAHVSRRIIDVFRLDDDTAAELLAGSVDRPLHNAHRRRKPLPTT